MKKLSITWDGVPDSTGYLFSFAKSLVCALKNSPWADQAEELVATSGFAFRMWVSADLCPSATSIWEWHKQASGVESGGFDCVYTSRLWGEDTVEEERRLQAIEQAKQSIDRGIPAISWDIGVPEWGLLTGYDDEKKVFAVLAINGEGEMPYDLLGKRDLPILSVLTITGKSDKSPEAVFRDTLRIALAHLNGDEWGNNAQGLAAYPALIRHFEGGFIPERSWNLDYFLGTYGALKEYAWRYFEKVGQGDLAAIYQAVFEAWNEALRLKTGGDINEPALRAQIAELLKSAHEKEVQAVEIMQGILAAGK